MSESTLTAHVADWFQSTGESPHEADYGRYPVAFVSRWIERAESAERQLLAVEESANPVLFMMSGRALSSHDD